MSCNISERDIKPIKLKKVKLDSALKIWKNLLDKSEEVLSELDKDINAYQERANKRMKWTVGICVVAFTGKHKRRPKLFITIQER